MARPQSPYDRTQFDYDYACRTARRICQSQPALRRRSGMTEDDLVADLASQAWVERAGFNPQLGTFSTWVGRVIRCRLLDRAKSGVRRGEVMGEYSHHRESAVRMAEKTHGVESLALSTKFSGRGKLPLPAQALADVIEYHQTTGQSLYEIHRRLRFERGFYGMMGFRRCPEQKSLYRAVARLMEAGRKRLAAQVG